MSKKARRSPGSHYDSKLASKRINLNLTLEELDELVEIDYRTLSAWETGFKQIIPDTVSEKALKNYMDLFDIKSKVELEDLLAEAYYIRQDGPGVYKTEFMTPMRKFRIDRNILVADAAKYIGVDPATYRNWELGYNRAPSKDEYVDKFASFYGITVEEVDKLFFDSYTTRPENVKSVNVEKSKTVDNTVKTKTEVEPKALTTEEERYADPDFGGDGDITVIVSAPAKTAEPLEIPTILVPNRKKVSTTDINRYESMLQRVYGKIDFNDFNILQDLINTIKEI